MHDRGWGTPGFLTRSSQAKGAAHPSSCEVTRDFSRLAVDNKSNGAEIVLFVWISNFGPIATTVLGAFISAIGAFLKSEHDMRSKIDTAVKHTRRPAVVILIGALLSVVGALWFGQN